MPALSTLALHLVSSACCISWAPPRSVSAVNLSLPCSPLMLSDSSSAHSVPKYGRQYSLEHVHGPGPYSVSIKLHETSLVGAGWPKLPQVCLACGLCL